MFRQPRVAPDQERGQWEPDEIRAKKSRDARGRALRGPADLDPLLLLVGDLHGKGLRTGGIMLLPAEGDPVRVLVNPEQRDENLEVFLKAVDPRTGTGIAPGTIPTGSDQVRAPVSVARLNPTGEPFPRKA